MRKSTMVLALAAVTALAACQKTGEDEYQVQTPDIDVSTDTSTIRTPDVDVGTQPETTIINRPTVDVNRPGATDTARRPRTP